MKNGLQLLSNRRTASVLGIFVLNFLENRALARVDIIAPEGIKDASDFLLSDETGLQIERIRIVSVQKVDGALVMKGFRALLIKDGG